jgi:TonB family protein
MWASVGGAVLVLVLVVLFGPSREDVERRWEFSGKEGPLELLPQLSIEDGSDERHQELLRRVQDYSPPAPSFEVLETEGEEPTRDEVSPEPDPSTVIDPEAEPAWDAYDTVELKLPTQTHPCFHLQRQVYPRYPADATGADRTRPLITVRVAFFVGPDGRVDGSYIMDSDGSAPFDEVVLKAVDQWRYLPDFNACSSPDGFWNVLTVLFRSPVGP